MFVRIWLYCCYDGKTITVEKKTKDKTSVEYSKSTDASRCVEKEESQNSSSPWYSSRFTRGIGGESSSRRVRRKSS